MEGARLMTNIPTSNVLIALKNILTTNGTIMPLVIDHKNSNRVNSSGDLLEYYVKDAFCGDSYHLGMTDEKLKRYQETFSYLGNSNNPPDFVVKYGVAVEVKKVEGENPNNLALNSSFPKDYLHSDDVRIKKECRECEDEYGGWTKKDIIYAVGNVKENYLHSLWLIYGDCYCADKSTYEKIATTIKNEVSIIPEVEFAETKELGRVNKVDPLGITYLRIRGMWGIEHPSAIFKSYIPSEKSKKNVFVLMKKETYDGLDEKPCFNEFIEKDMLEIREIKIPNPNNPARNLNALLFVASL